MAHNFRDSVYLVAWPYCLWACGETEHLDDECVLEETAYLKAAGKQKEREEGVGVPISP
jgi:hypothetical protein